VTKLRDLKPRNRGSIADEGKKFYLLYCVRTGPEGHTASYLISSGGKEEVLEAELIFC